MSQKKKKKQGMTVAAGATVTASPVKKTSKRSHKRDAHVTPDESNTAITSIATSTCDIGTDTDMASTCTTHTQTEAHADFRVIASEIQLLLLQVRVYLEKQAHAIDHIHAQAHDDMCDADAAIIAPLRVLDAEQLKERYRVIQ